MVLEQLGNGLITETARRCFYNDFLQMEEIVRKKGDEYDVDSAEPFLLLSQSSPGAAAEAPRLYQQQLGLSSILESSASYEEAMHLLAQSSPANSDWRIEQWEPYMIETAVKIAQKWKK